MTEHRRRVYSRRGDLGETSLSFGPRVGKDHVRVEVCGALDELSSWLGLLRASCSCSKRIELLRLIQEKLLAVGAEVSTLDPPRYRVPTVGQKDIAAIEEVIDRLDESLPPLNHFILPGETRREAEWHLARAVCRRAERAMVALVRQDETVSRLLIAWLNRLADLLFVLARVEGGAVCQSPTSLPVAGQESDEA